MVNAVSSAAYSRRAGEYIDLLGSMAAVHPSDLQLVSTWANDVDGEIIDADCGPGHWRNLLIEQGHCARGVDLVPEFITHSRTSYPRVKFTLHSLDSLDAVTPAYRWPVDGLAAELCACGFEAVESHVRTITGQRPLGAIVARRRDAL